VVDLLPKNVAECSHDNVFARANLAAALGANNQPEKGYIILEAVKSCKLEKSDQFNLAKLAMVAGKLDIAKSLFDAPELHDSNRPDLRARVTFDIGILQMLAKKEGWQDDAIKSFRMALCLDSDLKNLIVSGQETAKTDLPGDLVEDFNFELKVLAKEENRDFLTALKNNVTTKDACA
jgi:hypothetical protein